MDDKKNRVLITVVTVCWAFMLWWWLIGCGGILSAIGLLLVPAIAGGIAWFVVGILT